MPVVDYTTYCKMFDRAREGHYAYPAFNVTSLTSANAVLKGLGESRSDGIIQVSTGGGAFASGSSVKDMARRPSRPSFAVGATEGVLGCCTYREYKGGRNVYDNRRK